jgi:hypothetical protein
MPGVVHLPWYATGLRADGLADALTRIAPVAMRYGAIDYTVYRFREDRYKFMQTATFESYIDFARYWEGEEFISFRVNHQGWYQVPILYSWADRISAGGYEPEPVIGEPGVTGDTL